MGDDGQSGRRGLSGRDLDPADPPGGHRGAHKHGVRHIGKAEVARVRRGTGYLQRAVHPVNARPDQPDSLDGGHGVTPVTVCRARTSVRFANSTLNAVPGTVNGSRTVASAAARKVSPVAGASRSTRPASQARHGTVPTPPRPIRASRITPSSTTTATPAEVSANSYEVRARTLRYVNRASSPTSGISHPAISSPS